MMQKDIAKKLDVPFSTQKDWAKKGHPRNKLYQFLQKLSPEEFEQINSRPDVKGRTKQPKTHRLSHIVNRNTTLHYSLEEIINIFADGEHEEMSIDERIVVEKFFKECDAQDYKKLLLFKGVSAKRIRSLFLASQASRSLYAFEWAERLGVDLPAAPQRMAPKSVPRAVAMIQEQRKANA